MSRSKLILIILILLGALLLPYGVKSYESNKTNIRDKSEQLYIAPEG